MVILNLCEQEKVGQSIMALFKKTTCVDRQILPLTTNKYIKRFVLYDYA